MHEADRVGTRTEGEAPLEVGAGRLEALEAIAAVSRPGVFADVVVGRRLLEAVAEADRVPVTTASRTCSQAGEREEVAIVDLDD